MSITITPKATVNYTPSRGGKKISCIKLHSENNVTLEQLDNLACRKCVPNGTKHCSFHYAIDNCIVHQYVQDSDTAWSGNSDAQTCIDIFVAGTKPTEDTVCPVYYSPRVQECLAKLICRVAKVNGLSCADVSVMSGELPGFPLQSVIDMAAACIKSVDTQPCSSSPACFCNREEVDGCFSRDGLAVWDGKCMKELVANRSVTACDYNGSMVIDGASPIFKGVQIDGRFYPADIPITFPTAPEVTAFLNSIGLGVVAVNFVSGGTTNYTISITTLANERVFELYQYEVGGAPRVDNFVASNCAPKTILAPITGKDIVALLGLSCPAPVPLPTCFGLIKFDCGTCAPILDWSSFVFDLTSIGGSATEAFADAAALIARVNTLTGGTWTWNFQFSRMESSAAGCADFVITACKPTPPPTLNMPCIPYVVPRDICYKDNTGACKLGFLYETKDSCTLATLAWVIFDELNVIVAQSPGAMPTLENCATCGCVNCA